MTPDEIKIWDNWNDDDLIMPGADEETRWMWRIRDALKKASKSDALPNT